MKKAGFLFLSLLLLLTGCAQNAPLVAEAMKNNLTVTSYEAQSIVSIDTNLPTEDEQAKSLLQILKKGVILQNQQKNDQDGHLTLSFVDPSPILGTQIWPSKIKPAFDVYSQGQNTFLKSTIDDKFFSMPANGPESIPSNEQTNAFSEKLAEGILSKNQFNLKNVKTIGEESINLPDGSYEKTTHVRITIDFQEAIDYLTYLVEQLSQTPDLEKVIGNIPHDSAPLNGLDGLTEIEKNLKSIDVKQLQSEGWDGHITLDTWINSDKLFVQNDVTLSVNAPGKALSEDGVIPTSQLKPIYITLHTHEQYWNQNKEVTYPIPGNDQTITVDQIQKKPRLIQSFGKGSPIRSLASFVMAIDKTPFDDVPDDHWANEPIMTLSGLGVTKGYGNDEFKPDQPITRAEFITMAIRSLGLDSIAADLNFKDKKQIPNWANESIQTAIQAGLVKGYDDGTLRPNQKISRDEMITILVRGLGLSPNNEYLLSYKDTNDIPQWALPFVKTATANGLIKGNPDHLFAPNKNASRAEVATVLYNVIFDNTNK